MVDNTNRTLHGALLDAGLLAEVYIRLTRGQDSLVMDLGDEGKNAAGDGPRVAAVDLRSFMLAVPVASADEEAAHEAVLKEIDKSSGGASIWRNLVAQ